MRRLVFPIIVASGLVIVGAGPASAEDASTTSTAKAAAGKKVCKVTDPLLNELSGIVATDDGYIAVNDSSQSDEKKKIFLLSSKCAIKDSVSFSGDGPGDTEDMVLSPDGETLWIADTGDNAIRNDELEPRPTIALWSMPADLSAKPKIHRLAYPSGDKHDAETLLLDGDGKPLIITKEVSGAAQIYKPTAALKTNNKEGVPLAKVGSVELPRTDTAGTPFAKLAQSVATGGAIAPGGGKVVIRSYLAAYEWDVKGGDVVASLKSKPRATGLPNEPFGEAISYTPDGKNFVTVSDLGSFTSDPPDNYILRYTPATEVVKAAADKGGTGGGDGKSWYSDLTLSDITWLVAGVGIIGLLLVGAGVLGIVRHRKKHPAEAPSALKEADDDLLGSPKPADAATELLTVGGPPAGTYGAAASGPVYGAKQQGKGVYGGGPGGGPAAGGPGSGGPGGRPGAAQPGRPAGAAQPGRPAGAAPAGRPGGAAAGAAQPGRPGGAQSGRPGGAAGAARPAGPGGAAQGGRPGGGAAPVRPGGGAGQPGRPAGGPQGRPGGGPQGRPGGGSGGGQQGRPAGGPGGGPQGRPAGGPGGAGGGQQGRPAGGAGGGQQGRPAGGPQGRPGGGQQGRPQGGQGRPDGGQQGRPAGGQQGRPAGGQPGRPAGGQQGRPAGGQQPGQGGGQPGRGAATPPPSRGGQQPGGRQPRPGGGVYGGNPQGGGGGRQASGSARPSGFVGGGPAGGGPAGNGQRPGPANPPRRPGDDPNQGRNPR